MKFTSDNTEDYNQTFSLLELKQALQKSNDSAVGPDDIHYKLLTNLPESSLTLLLNTENSTRLTGCPSALCALCVSRLSDELALSEDPVAQFTDTLIEITNQTIPKSHISKNKLPKVRWFNDVCKQAIKERKKAQRKLLRNPTAEMYLRLSN